MFFLLSDAVLMSLSVILAFLVRFEGRIPVQYFINIPGIIALLLLITLPIFYFSKLYYFTWLYVSTTELISLAKATFLSFLLLTASFVILREHPIFSGFPRSTLFITYFFLFLLCGGLRFAKRIYLQMFSRKGNEGKERTLIVGAGDAGELVIREIKRNKALGYNPIGLIDDDLAKLGYKIQGVPVLGTRGQIKDLVQAENIEEVIIAIPSVSTEAFYDIVKICKSCGVQYRKIRGLLDKEEMIDDLGEIKDN